MLYLSAYFVLSTHLNVGFQAVFGLGDTSNELIKAYVELFHPIAFRHPTGIRITKNC